MPLITSTPQAVRQADHFRVFEVDILTDPPRLRIYWQKSVQQRDAANAVVVDPDSGLPQIATTVDSGSTIVPADVLATQNPDSTKTWQENIKALAYQLMQDSGEFPAGTVT